MQLLKPSDGKIIQSYYSTVSRDGVGYYNLKKGDICYLACDSYEGATNYTVSVKKVIATTVVENKEHAMTIRKETKASTIAEPQAKASIDYLNQIYATNKSFSTRIDHAQQSDVEAFKKMAGIITEGCKTDKQKVDAIAKWVKNNITYDTNTSSYSCAVFKTRRGDCLGMTSLICDFCRVLGMPAAGVAGWKADLTKWSVDDLNNSSERYDFAGHDWPMIYFDGKWHMYDILFDNLDVTDPAGMAEKGYYSSWVEGISIIGDGVDTALAGNGRILTAAYYKGAFVTLDHGLLCNYGYEYQVDQDGEICKNVDPYGGTIGWNSLWMEDRFFPTMTSYLKYFPYSDEIASADGYGYDDGRKHPLNGYLYIDGWLHDVGDGDKTGLADPDGVLRNEDIVTEGDKTYYFDQAGRVWILNMDPKQYYLYDGQLYIKTGTTGSIILSDFETRLKNPDRYEIKYDFESAYDQDGNEVKLEDLVQIDKKTNTIKTLKAGYVDYGMDLWDKEENAFCSTGLTISYGISDQGKPEYSFKDSPVSSGEDSDDKPDDTPNNTPNEDPKDTTDVNPGVITDEDHVIQKVNLTQVSYVYDGKEKNPIVEAFDSKGNLISSKHYTISKSSGRKNVGKYKYTIKFKNGYTGEKTLYFTINPKPTKLTSLKKGSKKMKLKWKKVSSQASGYQIRYSTKSSMSGAKTVTVKKYKTSSKTISRLKKKKKYYVQIRTYKTVGKEKYYSNWSARKSVVTK